MQKAHHAYLTPLSIVLRNYRTKTTYITSGSLIDQLQMRAALRAYKGLI